MSEQSTAITKPRHDVFALLESAAFKKQLADALPNTLKPDRMVRLALTMVKKNSALVKCTPTSILACVVECAQLGLEPEGVLGHAYMVPFADQATLIVGYRGFVHLMYQSGMISEISAEIVRKGDEFSRTLGTERRLHHVPKPIPEDDSAANWLGAYAAVQFITGRTSFEYLEKTQIYASRARSRGYLRAIRDKKSNPWITDEAEMWKKTPIRKMVKRMPTSTSDQRATLLRAAMLDEYAERKGLLIPTLAGFEVNPEGPDVDTASDDAPIERTTEVDDSRGESREAFERDRHNSAEPVKKSAPKSAGKKSAKPAPASGGTSTTTASGIPRAQIPKDNVIDVTPVKPAANDPLITSAECSDVYNKAAQRGWAVPADVSFMLRERFKAENVTKVRRSQLAQVLEIVSKPRQ